MNARIIIAAAVLALLLAAGIITGLIIIGKLDAAKEQADHDRIAAICDEEHDRVVDLDKWLKCFTPTTMRYRFSGNSDGGSAILEWQAQIATDAAFTQNVQTVGSGGITTFGGLTPSKRYYARSRGRNAWGWGAWSSTIDAETLSGARAWDGATWRQCKVRRWNGTTWQYVRVRACDGATWRNTK